MMNDTKSGGNAGMVMPSGPETSGWGNKGKSGPNKPATQGSGINATNPHVGNGKGERIKGGPFVGV